MSGDTLVIDSRPTRSRWTICAALLALVATLGVGGKALAWRGGEPEGADVPHPGGSLLICGGGKTTDEVRDQFFKLAGGKTARIVVIPTAHEAADTTAVDVLYAKPWRDRNPASVVLLHTRSRDTADSPEFVKPLTEATAVWIAGGVQAKLSSAYAGTEVERQLQALLKRGGVIGGTSAGAAIMTRTMIASGRTVAVEGRGFDLFSGAVVDQHFLRRKRMGRLTGFLATHPGLLGFGIDEQTALLVQGNHLKVLGESYVVACVPKPDGGPPRVEYLKRGDEADLASMRGADPKVTAVSMDADDALAAGR